jgi:hypothetical protein
MTKWKAMFANLLGARERFPRPDDREKQSDEEMDIYHRLAENFNEERCCRQWLYFKALHLEIFRFASHDLISHLGPLK